MYQMLRGHEQFRIIRQTYSFSSTLHWQFETLQYCSRGNNVDILNRREVVSMARFSWRRQLRFIGHFHVIARGPNFIYTRRKVGARYYLDLLQLLEFPLQTRLAWQRLFQRELQRRRFEIFKYLHSIRGWTTLRETLQHHLRNLFVQTCSVRAKAEKLWSFIKFNVIDQERYTGEWSCIACEQSEIDIISLLALIAT